MPDRSSRPESRPPESRPLESVGAPVGVRELRNNVAALLRRARAGERVVVTVDGHPVAQLGPLTPDRTGVGLWDLAGAGLIVPPRRHDRPDAPRPRPIPADVRAERLLDPVRGR